MSTITDITVSKIYVLSVAPKTRVLDRFWYDTTNKILKKCVSTDQSKTDTECWEPIGIDPSAVKVTVENGQGNSTTLDLQTYVSAVAEGLIEISGQVTNLNNTKADKTSLDTKQDKLNYYNEGDNVANITSETTNTNNVVAKNITLGGYDTGEDILFHVGSRAKLNLETQETSQENCIFGSLVDKELSEESLETHIPTSSAVVSYVDNQTTPIKEDIVDLQQTKSNRGEFWFNGGALTTTNKMPLNTPFSCIWTMAMTQEEFKKHKTFFPKIIGNLGYWSDAGYGWCINRLGTSLIGVGANNVGGPGKYNPLDIINYLDGNPHIWSVVYNGINISLYIDNVKKISLAFTFESSESTYPLGIGSTPTSANQNYGVWGKFSRIKYFNFDMSDVNAPYTIADYISGKDESPLLQGSQPVFDWKRVPTTATLVGNKLSFETGTTSQSYVYPLGETTQLKSGKTYILKGISNVVVGFYADKTSGANTCNVSWQTINKTTSTVSTGSATNFYNPIMPFVNGEDVEFTIVFTPLVDDMIIYTYFPVGTIGYLEFYSAEQVRALLSLEDYSIEDKVLDISGNNNHATITGSVYGSKSGSVEKFVETVIGDVHEIVDDLRDEVNLLSQQITISTHTSTFTSSSTDITNIYEDDTKAALPGRIMIQPKLSNVAPMYFGENVSDKTKAFPLYPDQITDFYFEDINNFKVASDAVGDGCNFVIEWGVTNVVADIASAFTMYDNNGNKYKISIVKNSIAIT